MIQKLTIDVRVPEGFTALEYRNPLIGEWFLTISGDACQCSSPHQTCETRIILRKNWAFPAWFKSGWWLFKTQPGTWYVGQNNWFYGSDTTAFYAPLLWEFHGQEFESPIGVKELHCQR